MTGSRSRKFPLTRHKTGQWCKKIHGKLFYNGTDKHAAYERYLREAANLHAGKPHVEDGNWTETTVKDLANHYLGYQLERKNACKLSVVHVQDCRTILERFTGAVENRH